MAWGVNLRRFLFWTLGVFRVTVKIIHNAGCVVEVMVPGDLHIDLDVAARVYVILKILDTVKYTRVVRVCHHLTLIVMIRIAHVMIDPL